MESTKPKIGSLKRLINLINPLARLMKSIREKTQIPNIRDKIESIFVDPADIIKSILLIN